MTQEPAKTASPEVTSSLETGTPSSGGALNTSTPAATPMGTQEATLPDTGLRIQTNPARISDLLTYTIVDNSGNDVGSIQDMVLDLRTRKIRWVVVNPAQSSTPSASDTGSSVLVPWRALELDLSQASGPGMFSPAEKTFKLTVDPAVFAAAPTIDLASLNFFAPDFDLQTWDRAQSSYWAQQGGVDVNQGNDLGNSVPSNSGSSNAQTTPLATPQTTPMATPQATQMATPLATASVQVTGTPGAATTSGNHGLGQGIERMLRATDLISMPVSGQNGDRFATVNDAIVDARNGQVLFLVLSDLQGLNLGQDVMVVVPLIVFREGTLGEGLQLPYDLTTLSNLPSLTLEELNNPDSTVWQDNLWNFWQDLGLPGNEPDGQ